MQSEAIGEAVASCVESAEEVDMTVGRGLQTSADGMRWTELGPRDAGMKEFTQMVDSEKGCAKT